MLLFSGDEFTLYKNDLWFIPAVYNCLVTWTKFWIQGMYFFLNFFLNNQPDTLIIQILFCYKTLHVSGIFSAHHQEFYTVHLALVIFMQVLDNQFQAESGLNWLHPDSAWKRSSKTYMKLTSAECTVGDSWWWAKKMPETCRVLWQNKFG